MKGYFITFEGPEGAGKTTILNMLEQELKNKGFDVISTREPGGIDIAEQIRSVILDKRNTNMDGRTEALLYAAARRQHLIEKISPALSEGKIVLCDRFIDSSLAYQGHARGLGIDDVFSINDFAIEGVMPSLTIFFNLSPEKGLERIAKSESREINRLDLEKSEFHHKVYEGYIKLSELFRNRIRIVNADQSVERVFQEVNALIIDHLQKS